MSSQHDNFILKSDSYKHSHWKQLPPGCTYAYSYFESRGGLWPETVFFGLQYILQTHFEGRVINRTKIAQVKHRCAAHFGNDTIFNEAGWLSMLEKYDGYLPLKIRGAYEGTPIGTSNVLMTVTNTDPEFPWLVGHAETLLSQLWYPCTVATASREWKKTIARHLEKSGTPESIDFRLHDFGYRGSTSHESAGIGGAAHLVNFKGTDTMAALEMLEEHYDEEMAGFSIPAAEHSTIMSWGREHEADAYANILDSFPTGPVAVVSDTYDIFEACKNLWGGKLKDKVTSRKGLTVIRPDSGDPPTTVLKVLNLLGDTFGFVRNAKEYKVLPDCVRVIQGDGIEQGMISAIYMEIEAAGWSSDNVSFGSGGGLLQKWNRDTSRYAFRLSEVYVNGEARPVFKDPITDPSKASKPGRLSLFWNENGYTTGPVNVGEDVMNTRFLDGKVMHRTNLAEVRRNARL